MMERADQSQYAEFINRSPSEVAAALIEAAPSACWIDRLVDELAGFAPRTGLDRLLEIWGLNRTEFARYVGVSRQAISRWATQIPRDRMAFVHDLEAATESLLDRFPRHRIPALVRHPAPALDDRPLTDWLSSDRPGSITAAAKAVAPD